MNRSNRISSIFILFLLCHCNLLEIADPYRHPHTVYKGNLTLTPEELEYGMLLDYKGNRYINCWAVINTANKPNSYMIGSKGSLRGTTLMCYAPTNDPDGWPACLAVVHTVHVPKRRSLMSYYLAQEEIEEQFITMRACGHLSPNVDYGCGKNRDAKRCEVRMSPKSRAEYVVCCCRSNLCNRNVYILPPVDKKDLPPPEKHELFVSFFTPFTPSIFLILFLIGSIFAVALALYRHFGRNAVQRDAQTPHHIPLFEFECIRVPLENSNSNERNRAASSRFESAPIAGDLLEVAVLQCESTENNSADEEESSSESTTLTIAHTDPV